MDDLSIFEAVHPALRKFASVVAPVGVDPDDLIQDALERTLRSCQLSELTEPLPYLRRAVLNNAISHTRSSTRRAAIDARIQVVEPNKDLYPSDLEDLLNVPADQRAVLYLRIVESMEHSEIAETLGISSETSRARYSRGLRQLRIEMNEQEVQP